MVAHGYALGVSTLFKHTYIDWIDADTIYLLTVDFALTEAAYTIVRLIRSFQTIKLPEGETPELVGVEKQVMTLVISIKEGCKVEMY
jgi:hypothetical protein